jgi:addiction module HigA family antidote
VRGGRETSVIVPTSPPRQVLRGKLFQCPQIVLRKFPQHILCEEFVVPLGLTAGKLAKACNVPRTRIGRIVNEEMGISADTAVRLGKVLGTSAEFWLNLQARYDLRIAKRALGKRVESLAVLNPASKAA